MNIYMNIYIYGASAGEENAKQLSAWLAKVGPTKAQEVVQSLPNRGTKSTAEVRRDRMVSLSGASMSKKDVNAALTLAGRHDGGSLSRSHPLSISLPAIPSTHTHGCPQARRA